MSSIKETLLYKSYCLENLIEYMFYNYTPFIDTYMKYNLIYFFQQPKALHPFKLFLNFFKTQFHTTLKSLQSYYQAEFRSFTKYLYELGISHRMAFHQTSHQNGIVERKHKYIVELGLTILSNSTILLKLLDHNFSTFVHIINRLSTVGLTKFHSPYHALYQKLPNYKSIKVFGCTCFPFTRPYNKHELEFRSQ